MADASGAIDAAVEAVKAAAVASAAATTDDAVWQLNDDTEYFNMSGIYSENVPELVRIAVEAAAPVLLAEHERQVREKCAEELRARVADITEIVGPRAVRRRAFQAAANHVAPKWTPEEIAESLRRGDFIACYLDDAGQSVAGKPDTQGGHSG